MKAAASLLMALMLSPAVAMADELCVRQKAFEAAPFTDNARPDGLPDRWVELHWVGRWLDFDHGWGIRCLHSGDTEAEQYCAWLLDRRLSFEFADNFPLELLGCRGYRLPHSTDWREWKATLELLGPDERSVTLEVDFSDWGEETLDNGAVRVAVYRDDDSAYGDIAPLAPLPPETPR
jgi:hypothetical protein